MKAHTGGGDSTMYGGQLARLEARQMGDNAQLQELHDSYTWEVNAAVGEGRLDLVWRLADEYLDKALELVTIGEPSGCGREDCVVCQRPRQAPSRPRRRGWLRRARS